MLRRLPLTILMVLAVALSASAQALSDADHADAPPGRTITATLIDRLEV